MKTTKDKIIVKALDEDTSAMGIWLGDDYKGDPLQRGLVQAVGPDIEKEIKVGDTIIFKRNAGHEFDIDKEGYVWFTAEYALALEKKEEK